MHTCPNCGTENSETAKFCSECGAPFGPVAVAVREERKVVSVLFADLVGSTAAAEGLDPEDVRARLGRYHERARTEIERFGGTVEKFIGDAVVGLFGVPAAHEDDPERAVRAAIAVHEAIAELNEGDPSLDLEIRIGITTGEALVRLDADVRSGEAAAAGDVMNTAARLQAAAAPGAVLVGEPTWRATRHAIDYRKVTPVEAKGKAKPVAAWQARAARSRLGVDVTQRGPTELVGRRRELDLLLDALARAREERETQLVTLVGVPGIGKSRLVFEVLGVVNKQPDLVYWRQGRCLPYGDGITYWALGEMVKAQAGILETDGEHRAGEKLRQSVERVAGDDADWVERHLHPLLGLEGDERSYGDREEAFAAWRRFFEGLADERPLVLVFEDLHWADDELLDFVEHLVDWARGVPLLVLCTARPELLERRPHWGGGKLNATTVALSPLTDDETANLLAALAGRAVMPAKTQSALIARAGGNPLFAEQFVRMLADRGIDGDGEVPETVQGIIAARVDGLPSEEKDVLQGGAVLGKVFWSGAVAESTGRARSDVDERLHALERKEFVRRQRRSSVEGEGEFAFRHVLVRDVAYAQIPRSRRADKHRLAAEWLESLGRPQDHAEMVAHHYASALELARAAGGETAELVERSRLAFRDAGARAARLTANRAATSFFTAALELWPDDRERPALLLERARARARTGEWIEDECAETRESLLAQGDRAGAAEAETMLADLARVHGNAERRTSHLERARGLVEDEPPSWSQAWVLTRVGWDQLFASRYSEALVLAKQALEIATALDDGELLAQVLNLVGSARAALDDDGGLDDLERSLAIALDLNSTEALHAAQNLAVALHERGRLEEAFALQDHALGLAERFGQRLSVTNMRGAKVEELYLTGRLDESLALATELIDAKEFEIVTSMAGAWRARGRLARDDLEGASADAAHVVAFNRKAQDRRTLWEALALDARVKAAAGNRTSAARLGVEVLDEWRSTRQIPAGSPPIWLFDLQAALVELGNAGELLEAVAATPRSTLWLDAAAAVARGDFSAAAEIYAGTGAQSEEAFARLCAAKALTAVGRRPEADVELGQALAFYRSAGATRYVVEGEALLAASA
jgi:class 3 adenylate cyclase/tetratricopeptide (TPR) repeat protein